VTGHEVALPDNDSVIWARMVVADLSRDLTTCGFPIRPMQFPRVDITPVDLTETCPSSSQTSSMLRPASTRLLPKACRNTVQHSVNVSMAMNRARVLAGCEPG
jgi:hypothetical protein